MEPTPNKGVLINGWIIRTPSVLNNNQETKIFCYCALCERKVKRTIKYIKAGRSKCCAFCAQQARRLSVTSVKPVYHPGDTVGNWLILDKVTSYNSRQKARCKCTKCDKVYEVRKYSLIHKLTTQCRSCAIAEGREKKLKHLEENPQDLIYPKGKLIGDWTLLEDLYRVQRGKKIKCQCSCGNIREVYRYGLIKGKTLRCKSCASRRTMLMRHKCKKTKHA